MSEKKKEFGKLLHDTETGDVVDIHGNVIFNTKKQKPHEQSRIFDVLHKAWDFFELSDEKVLAWIKRNTIERFKRRRVEEFDLDEFIENAENGNGMKDVINEVKEDAKSDIVSEIKEKLENE